MVGRLRLLIAAVMVVLLVAACTPEQGEVFTNLENTRLSQGLPKLRWHADLATKAQRHAEEMLRAGRIYHSDLRAGVPSSVCWVSLGENVAVGHDLKGIHDAWMRSESHRRNILGNWTHVGTGVAKRSDGAYFAVQFFMRHC